MIRIFLIFFLVFSKSVVFGQCSNQKKAAELYVEAIKSYLTNDYQACVKLISQSIIECPEKADFSYYYFRGTSKAMLNDYRGAVSDLNKCISMKPNYGDGYYWRAYSLGAMGKYAESVSDYSYIINNKLASEQNSYLLCDVYVERALGKISLNQIESGCQDLSKAGEFNSTKGYNPYALIQKYCR